MSLFHLNRWGLLVGKNGGLTRLWFWSCFVGGQGKQHFSLSSFVFSMLRTAFSLAGWVSLIKATNADTRSGWGRHSESGGEIAPRIWDSEWMPKGCSPGSFWLQYLVEFLIFYFTNWHYEHQRCNSASFHRPLDFFATDSGCTQPLRFFVPLPILRHECIIPGQKTVAAGLKWWFLLQVHLHVGWLPTHQIQDRYFFLDCFQLVLLISSFSSIPF